MEHTKICLVVGNNSNALHHYHEIDTIGTLLDIEEDDAYGRTFYVEVHGTGQWINEKDIFIIGSL